MTIRVVFHLTTNTVGTDTWEAWEFPDNIPYKTIEETAYERAVENAEMYGIYPPPFDQDDVEEEDADCYDDSIGGTVYEYDASKHDMHLIFGCNSDFEWNKY